MDCIYIAPFYSTDCSQRCHRGCHARWRLDHQVQAPSAQAVPKVSGGPGLKENTFCIVVSRCKIALGSLHSSYRSCAYCILHLAHVALISEDLHNQHSKETQHASQDGVPKLLWCCTHNALGSGLHSDLSCLFVRHTGRGFICR